MIYGNDWVIDDTYSQYCLKVEYGVLVDLVVKEDWS